MLRQALQGYRQAARRPAFRRFWLGMMLASRRCLHRGRPVLGRARPRGPGSARLGPDVLRFASDLAVAAVLLGLATFAWGPYYVFARTLMQRLVPEDVRSQAAGAQMTITALGFPLGSAVGGAVIGGIGVPAVILAIACSYLVLGLVPLLAPPLR